MDPQPLSEREHLVLEAIVRNYILKAEPTSSRYLSRQSGFDLCAASIRNVMSDLEEQGYITHPHTSAGRVPTDQGYRYYVDRLMYFTELPVEMKQQIRSAFVAVDQTDLHLLLEAASRALSRSTHQLGVILAPKLENGVLGQLYIFHLGEKRFILNIALDFGFVKTMLLEFETEIPRERLECACRILTAKFAGKTLAQMCAVDEGVYDDVPDFDLGVVQLLVPSIRKMVQTDTAVNVFTEGQTNVLLQPEFFDRDRVGAVIEILEEKTLLMHLFETAVDEDRVLVTIGGENSDGQFASFSIIKTKYMMGNMVGSLGVIGPKRMPYPLLISAVKYTANILGELVSS
ncbi:MAG: heat-inducible transcription repressor HrcA [Chitinispirillaceae bacterium]|nr:heat-inducible transcription repressor HrcA [Chitinispirillaceae bacterium]